MIVKPSPGRAAPPPRPTASQRERALADIERVFGALARRWALPKVRERLISAPGVEIDTTGFTLLRTLDLLAPVRASELAAGMGLDLSTISRQIATLHARGMIERTPDPEDRRAAMLAPSAKGRRELDRVLQARRALLADALGDWSAGDLRALAQLLERFADSVSAIGTATSSEGPDRVAQRERRAE